MVFGLWLCEQSLHSQPKTSVLYRIVALTLVMISNRTILIKTEGEKINRQERVIQKAKSAQH